MMRREEVFDSRSAGARAACLAWAIDRETAVVAPGDVFRHPREVLAHPTLSERDKRAILAAWASDAHAVASAPALRRLPGTAAETVPIDAVLAALAELDAEADAEARDDRPAGPRAQRRPLRIIARAFRNRRRDDDDDDPPPCPAAAMPWPRPPVPSVDAVAVAA